MWDSENMGRRGGAAWERSVGFRKLGTLSLGLQMEIKVWTFISSVRAVGARTVDGSDRKGLRG